MKITSNGIINESFRYLLTVNICSHDGDSDSDEWMVMASYEPSFDHVIDS
jgi:hypothetical protein